MPASRWFPADNKRQRRKAETYARDRGLTFYLVKFSAGSKIYVGNMLPRQTLQEIKAGTAKILEEKGSKL